MNLGTTVWTLRTEKFSKGRNGLDGDQGLAMNTKPLHSRQCFVWWRQPGAIFARRSRSRGICLPRTWLVTMWELSLHFLGMLTRALTLFHLYRCKSVSQETELQLCRAYHIELGCSVKRLRLLIALIRECEPFSHGNLDEGSSTRSLLEASTSIG